MHDSIVETSSLHCFTLLTYDDISNIDFLSEFRHCKRN